MESEERLEIWTGWGYVLVYGLTLLALAAFAILCPLAANFTVGVFWGVLLFGVGLASVAAGFVPLEGSLRWDSILVGLLAIAAGVLALIEPLTAALSLVIVLGAYLFASGLFGSVMALQSSYHRGLRLVVSVLDVALGTLLLFVFEPEISARFLAYAVAISLIGRGAFLVWIAIVLRRIEKGGSVAL
ncbi:MAG: hypothetical protein GX614_01160 [Sandaracinaceae bacterium]|nr:hypothetical protein [Sandaracinaceae bacterium]